MKQKTLILMLIVLFIAAFACNLPQSETAPTEDLALVVAQTQTAIAIQEFLTATIAPQQDIPVLPSPTQTSIPATTTIAHNTPTASPTPTATIQPDCTDKATFISETIPDETVFNPGAPFIKSWTLKNSGTCTWTPEYTLALVQGEAMSGPNPLPFGRTTLPESTIDLKLSQVAPSDPGEHSGYWKLQNPNGKEFGNLWVKITVSGGDSGDTTGLGSPTWVESFDGSSSFALGSDGNTDFSVNNGNLVLTALAALGDQWRISNKGYLDDFYLEVSFKTGAACNGKDSYGMIVRAPDQPDNIIDSTYVINFSCEGKFRVYRMDNGSYTSIQNWAANSNIKSGSEKANSMGIKAKGGIIQVFANGSLVFEFTDSAYSTGYFGLVIRSEITNNFQVYVSKISYWDLSQ